MLFRDEILERRIRCMALQHPRLLVQSFQRGKFFVTTKPRILNRKFEHPNRLIVNTKWYWKRMPVLAAMGQGEPRGIGEAIRRAVHDLSDKS